MSEAKRPRARPHDGHGSEGVAAVGSIGISCAQFRVESFMGVSCATLFASMIRF
jgi:hypothetical protein